MLYRMSSKPSGKSRGIAAALLFFPALSCSAAISVNYHGADLPQNVTGQMLVEGAGLSAGYARIENSSHTNFGGSSAITFGRYFDGANNCVYWFRATDTLGSFYDSWEYVYWQGFGDGTLVDGAVWGTDNFVLLQNGGTAIAVLQFEFVQSTGDVRLIASAVDMSGITFSAGVAALQQVPEPGAAVLAGTALLALLTRRRRN